MGPEYIPTFSAIPVNSHWPARMATQSACSSHRDTCTEMYSQVSATERTGTVHTTEKVNLKWVTKSRLWNNIEIAGPVEWCIRNISTVSEFCNTLSACIMYEAVSSWNYNAISLHCFDMKTKHKKAKCVLFLSGGGWVPVPWWNWGNSCFLRF